MRKQISHFIRTIYVFFPVSSTRPHTDRTGHKETIERTATRATASKLLDTHIAVSTTCLSLTSCKASGPIAPELPPKPSQNQNDATAHSRCPRTYPSVPTGGQLLKHATSGRRTPPETNSLPTTTRSTPSTSPAVGVRRGESNISAFGFASSMAPPRRKTPAFSPHTVDGAPCLSSSEGGAAPSITSRLRRLDERLDLVHVVVPRGIRVEALV